MRKGEAAAAISVTDPWDADQFLRLFSAQTSQEMAVITAHAPVRHPATIATISIDFCHPGVTNTTYVLAPTPFIVTE